MSSDDAVQSTNDDAAHCKRFAVSQGYWKDPYLQYFVKSSDRKAPEISRGYFARVSGVKLLLRQFIQLTKSGCQIVNLGAGFDTLYWLLQDEGLSPRNFTEIDFQGITSKKCYYIKSRKQLLEKIAKEDGEISFNSFDLHAANYHIVAADLRDVAQVTRKLHEAGIDPKLPTAFIAECVLVYMETSKSEALLKYFADHFHTAFFINYEQVNMEDRFGEVMLQNLRIRHCDLQGVPACRSLDTQKNRFLQNGWEGADAVTMNTLYGLLPQHEVQRIEKLEFMDEQELLQQLFDHYCLCWAYKDHKKLGLKNISLVPDG